MANAATRRRDETVPLPPRLASLAQLESLTSKLEARLRSAPNEEELDVENDAMEAVRCRLPRSLRVRLKAAYAERLQELRNGGEQ